MSDTAEFLSSKLASLAEDHPCFGAFGRACYPKVFGDTRTDISFERDGVLVLATRGADIIDYYGFPVQVYSSERILESEIKAALAPIATSGAIRISDYDYGNSPLAMACSSLGLNPTLKANAWCDLSGGETEIHRHLRKSYRSLVNWGRDNLALTHVNQSNPDRAACAEYQDFHKKVAGRSTRSQESWDVMFDWIASGRGELSLARLDGELVSGTMVIDGTTTAYYASGVYDRERFDKPLGHWPLYNSILRSADRGMKIFDLGDIPREGTVTKKEFDIGMFKRGFATELSAYVVWGRS